MNTELHQLYEKHYKSTGPLRCSIIDFYIKVNETSIINVHLDYLYKKDIEGNPGDGTDICVDIRPNGMFYLYDNVRNDILLNNINKDVIFEKLEQIERYWNWLQCVYIPKFGTLDDFFYRVFLWIREDLYSFCCCSLNSLTTSLAKDILTLSLSETIEVVIYFSFPTTSLIHLSYIGFVQKTALFNFSLVFDFDHFYQNL